MISIPFAFDPASIFVILLLVFGAPILVLGSIVFFWRARNASQDGEVDPQSGDAGRRPLHTVVSNDDV
jgi:hypothetical protein